MIKVNCVLFTGMKQQGSWVLLWLFFVLLDTFVTFMIKQTETLR